MLPGMAEANQSSVQLIALTADIDSRMCGKGTLTELDQNALYAPVSTWTKSRFQVGGVKALRYQSRFQPLAVFPKQPINFGS